MSAPFSIASRSQNDIRLILIYSFNDNVKNISAELSVMLFDSSVLFCRVWIQHRQGKLVLSQKFDLRLLL